MSLSRIYTLCLLVGALLMCGVARLSAYVFIKDLPKYTASSVTFQVKLGATPQLSGGRTPSSVGMEAVVAWNPYLGSLNFVASEQSAGGFSEGNGKNELYFGTSYRGSAFPSDTLAVTLINKKGSSRGECDIVVNSSESWDVFTGSRYGTHDLRRVLVHEMGHVVGLDHPDEASQYIGSLMNSTYGWVELPTWDDQEGAAELYGPGPQTMMPSVTDLTSGGTLYEDDYLSMQVSGVATSYQWYKDGVAIEGATSFKYTISALKPADAGRYTVKLSSKYNSLMSGEIVIKVIAHGPPVITSVSTPVSVQEGGKMTLSLNVQSRTYTSARWFKDGVLLPSDARYPWYIWSSTLTNYDMRPQDAGSYVLEMSNASGSTRSDPIVVTVTLPPLPSFTSVSSSVETMTVGYYHRLTAGGNNVHTTYAWYKDNVPVGTPGNSYDLTFYGVRIQDEGIYHCVATNTAGSVRSPDIIARVTSASERVVSLGRSDAALGIGEVLYAGVQLNDYYQKYSFQWYKDGKALEGSNGPSLQRTITSALDAGAYHLVITIGDTVMRTNTLHVSVEPERLQGRAAQQGGILYCLSVDGTKVERWNLADGTALEALSIGASARWLAASPKGVFVAVNGTEAQLYRHTPGSGAGFSAFSAPLARMIQAIVPVGDLLYLDLSHGGNQPAVFTLSADTGNAIAYKVAGSAIMASMVYSEVNTRLYGVFGRNGMTNLSELLVTGDGQIPDWVQGVDSRASGNFCFLMEGERHVLTDGGVICAARGREIVARLDVPVADHAVLADGSSMILSRGRLLRLNSSFKVDAFMSAPAGASRIFLSGGRGWALVHAPDGSHSLAPIDLGAWQAGSPPIPGFVAIDTTGLSLPADLSCVDSTGLLYLVDKEGSRVRIWSPVERRVTSEISLRGVPVSSCFLSDLDSLIFAYDDGWVTRLPLGGKSGERSIFYKDTAIRGRVLVPAGRKVAVHLPDSLALSLYDGETGVLAGQVTVPQVSHALGALVWVGSAESFYVVSYDGYYSGHTFMQTVPLAGAGTALPSRDVALGSASLRTNVSSLLRFNADGSRLVLGTGRVVDALTLSSLALLPCLPSDALWTKGAASRLCTISPEAGGVRVTRWSADYSAAEASLWLNCLGLALHQLPDGRLLVRGTYLGAPRYYILDTDMRLLSEDNAGTPRRLANMSVQADVGTGDDILVPGFVIRGDQAKTVLVRAVGPGLKQFSVTGVLEDPQMKLFDRTQLAVDQNNDWGLATNASRVRERSRDVRAFDLPEGGKDAVLLKAMQPGLYTVETKGLEGTTGRVLVELYDADEAPGDCRMINMSARCRVTPASVAVGGFVVQGAKPRKLLIRAVGPRLADYQVSGTLADPKLRLFSGQAVIAENDNWSAESAGTAALKAAFESTGAFPLAEGARDAAMIVELAPGNYTVWMESADGASGVALLELYEVE